MKEQEPIKIEIEDVTAEEEKTASGGTVNIEEELKKFGQQLADTIQSALNSDEVKKVQNDMQEGMKKFADEMGKAFDNVKETGPGQKVSEKVNEIDSSDVAQSFKTGLSQGLRWLSQEFGKLSDAIDGDGPPADEENKDITEL